MLQKGKVAPYGKEDTLCLKPDVLSVFVGINDCGSTLNDGAGSSPERFEKIYQMMLDEVLQQNPETRIVLCEPFVMPVGARKEDFASWKKLIELLQEKTRAVAEKNRAAFVQTRQLI